MCTRVLPRTYGHWSCGNSGFTPVEGTETSCGLRECKGVVHWRVLVEYVEPAVLSRSPSSPVRTSSSPTSLAPTGSARTTRLGWRTDDLGVRGEGWCRWTPGGKTLEGHSRRVCVWRGDLGRGRTPVSGGPLTVPPLGPPPDRPLPTRDDSSRYFPAPPVSGTLVPPPLSPSSPSTPGCLLGLK